MLNGLSLKAKLTILCVFLSSLTGVVGLSSYFTLSSVEQAYFFIPDQVMKKLIHVDEMFLSYRQLRVSIRTLGISGLTKERSELAVQETLNAIDDFEKSKSSYLTFAFVDGQKELFEKVEAAWADFKLTGSKILELNKQNTPEARIKMSEIFFGECPAKAKAFSIAIHNLESFHKGMVTKKVNEATIAGDRGKALVLIIVIISLFLGLVSGTFSSTILAKTLNRVNQDLAAAAEQTALGGSQLEISSSQLSSGSVQTASALEESVASLEELASMVKLNSESATSADRLSKESLSIAESGSKELTKLIQAISEISNSSKKIDEITTVIDEIAFQTNMLALNAAVEAARAGEQGKGFAVVADAVRNLAQRSSSAAKEIEKLIRENVEQTKRGADIAGSSGTILQQILQATVKVSELNNMIASGSKEQSVGLQQISTAVNELDQASQTNASTSENVAEFSRRLSEQGQNLSVLVGDLNRLVNGKNSITRPRAA